ncbi:MAG: hypothetical protein U9Q03_04085 [Patescibacteria group bacterium]|nr:hypothetical protein [Patescibacteria group bacterium]
MPFDIKKIQEEDGFLLYTLVREWEHEGHDVGLFILENPDVPDMDKSPSPMCECDFDVEEKIDENGRKCRLQVRDSHKCPHLAAFRELCRQEAREKYGDAWREMGVKEAILDIHKRVKAGEYLGTIWGGTIYLQTVGELLDVKVPWAEADELFEEERLQLHGAILADYVQYLRFPKELKGLMRYVIEVPLGWPNGEAGDGFVGSLCQLIEENTGTTHGRELFGDDFPRIRSERLLVLGLALLRVVIERAEKSRAVRKELHFSSLDGYAKHLAETMEKLRELESSAPYKYDTRSLKPHYLAHLMLSDPTLDTTRFRFPREVRHALSYLMHEDGPDWDAAERSMLKMEQVIAMYGRWESGGEAFWEHNYPHLSAGEAVQFGLSWLMSAVKSAEADSDVRDRIGRNLLWVAMNDCRKLAPRYAKLHKRLRAWQFLARKRSYVRMRVSIWRWNSRAKLQRLKDRIAKKFRKGKE